MSVAGGFVAVRFTQLFTNFVLLSAGVTLVGLGFLAQRAFSTPASQDSPDTIVLNDVRNRLTLTPMDVQAQTPAAPAPTAPAPAPLQVPLPPLNATPAPEPPPVTVDSPPTAATDNPVQPTSVEPSTVNSAVVRGTVPGLALLISVLLLVLGLMGFLLYLCGMARAKNCGHAVTLVLVGAVGGFLGFWTSGFALISGGMADEHAGSVLWMSEGSFRDTLNRELGFTVHDHFFGLMGNTGYFVTTANGSMAVPGLFLVQISLLLFSIGGIVGAGLERSRLFPMVLCQFAALAFVLPTSANWIWGGGWLSELGPNFGLGRGAFDLAGAGVVHESAGMCALAIAILMGRRQFAANAKKLLPRRPGHNVPYFMVGTVLLCGGMTGGNLIVTNLVDTDRLGIAALNTVLAGCGGVLAMWFILAVQERGLANPFMLGQGLIAGAVSVSACAGWFDTPVALVIGLIGGFVAGIGDQLLRRLGLDDPAGTISVQGLTGFWGLLAAGIFATGAAGAGTGWVYSGHLGQLFAQIIAAGVIGVCTFIGAFATFFVIDLAMGLRVDPHAEEEGLDGFQTGALGYQGDFD